MDFGLSGLNLCPRRACPERKKACPELAEALSEAEGEAEGSNGRVSIILC